MQPAQSLCAAGVGARIAGLQVRRTTPLHWPLLLDRRPRCPVLLVHSADQNAAFGLLCHSLPLPVATTIAILGARDCFSLLVNGIGRFLPYQREAVDVRCKQDALLPRPEGFDYLIQELRHIGRRFPVAPTYPCIMECLWTLCSGKGRQLSQYWHVSWLMTINDLRSWVLWSTRRLVLL
ncbi:uncharacterized protein K444DRAFT_607194 [Hyaloscypha bicolor E]|uniref:Uncharacterized protein n=1 Tax=Hyaloscypha bicolor E TaxID=1095630 RepID=A0A2J6TS49_9HELO|nr:uncharacterized protein K444DRAFT_607194 [Hyaloscypha bicolor E]PMD65798.1 hypothetical protein K444DRAFT_607194 [Hyaloscypha bicolor E]